MAAVLSQLAIALELETKLRADYDRVRRIPPIQPSYLTQTIRLWLIKIVIFIHVEK